jgi:chemotaxis receptor (MCP) glutamine deamidase CheD
MPAAFCLLDSDDQIGCISHISLLVAKACVTSDEAAEVKLNVEAAKKLVEHVKRTELQSKLNDDP